ncbi:MAG: nuclear transport factor 2 family protein [Cyclobacteriaceae bacterium]|nr:nuclear transport factor 2 family protein [Cyclobacteriaceae bacterium]
MKRITRILILSILIPFSGNAQSEEGQVNEVIERLFKGMQLGDSAMVHSTFHNNVSMATAYRNKENNAMLRRESSIGDFLKAVGTPHPETWNEEIWDVEVKIDGDFAQFWCKYAFYVGTEFSHCGIDSFHLHKGSNGWKIFHLADTRRSDQCNIPKEVSEKYKSN